MSQAQSSSNDTYQQTLRDMRQNVRQQLAVLPLAYSSDGITFGFQALLSLPLLTGGYVQLATTEGTRFLGQVMSKQVAEREGPSLSVKGDAGIGLQVGESRIAQTSYQIRLKYAEGQGVLLCRLTSDGVSPITPADLFEDAEITTATGEEIERYLGARSQGKTSLEIGHLREQADVHAALLATGFDRHTFLCGQSGSGKTYALGIILERLLLQTSLRMVIIDPNSDFVRLREMRPFNDVVARSTTPLTPEAYASLEERYDAATRDIRVVRPVPRGQHDANALRVRFSDLLPVVQGLVLQIDPLADLEEYSSLQTIIGRLGKHDYSLADVRAAAAADLSADGRRLALRISNLGVAEWDIWAEADEPSLAQMVINGDDWRALVLDVGGFSNPAEKSLVAAGIMGYLWSIRDRREPMLIVADEAHNICAQEPSDPIQAVATERAIRIAGEGRKYGLYMLMATQRPQKLHANVLSQCDNLVLMRMNSAGDLAHLASTFSFVPSSLIEQAARFGQGESIVAGKLVPSPLVVKFSGRLSQEGGSDVPTTWANRS